LTQLLILLIAINSTDSPHGDDFKISCSVCHSPKGWELDREIYSFDHNTTKLPLEGQHKSINCKLCHPTLVFSEAGIECSDCHIDMHHQTVGFDCSRCHTPDSWIVNNITDIHMQSRFPLLGPHIMAECIDCHLSASNLRFEPLGIECIDCHMEDYSSATNPNHVEGNISTNCLDCHSIYAFTWSGSGFNHLFFPLTDGHAISECNRCHTGNDYSNISSDCFSCHQEDYNASTNPNHLTTGLSTNCIECHTTRPDWQPADFPIHDSYFPLIQGHALTECNSCHNVDDYSNISSECFSCHQGDFIATTNPNHVTIDLSTDCIECHTIHPGWKPAGFPVHNAFFPLTQGHAFSECNRCHDVNNYSSASSDCYSCHQSDYESSTNPGHVAADLSTDCLECHTTRLGWKPADFTVHDALFFPIYSGKHREEWNDCVDCHTNTDNYAQFTCIDCHEHNRTEMDDKHLGDVPGYQYNSNACLDCHPMGTHE